MIDFEDMSACIMGPAWVTVVRGWERDLSMGDS